MSIGCKIIQSVTVTHLPPSCPNSIDLRALLLKGVAHSCRKSTPPTFTTMSVLLQDVTAVAWMASCSLRVAKRFSVSRARVAGMFFGPICSRNSSQSSLHLFKAEKTTTVPDVVDRAISDLTLYSTNRLGEPHCLSGQNVVLWLIRVGIFFLACPGRKMESSYPIWRWYCFNWFPPTGEVWNPFSCR